MDTGRPAESTKCALHEVKATKILLLVATKTTAVDSFWSWLQQQ